MTPSQAAKTANTYYKTTKTWKTAYNKDLEKNIPVKKENELENVFYFEAYLMCDFFFEMLIYSQIYFFFFTKKIPSAFQRIYLFFKQKKKCNYLSHHINKILQKLDFRFFFTFCRGA